MKKHNLLAFILLGTLLMACEDSKKDKAEWFSFNTAVLKPQFNAGEKATLEIVNNKNKTIDSIIYYVNTKKISKVEGHQKTELSFANEKLGYQNLKALVYTETIMQKQNTV